MLARRRQEKIIYWHHITLEARKSACLQHLQPTFETRAVLTKLSLTLRFEELEKATLRFRGVSHSLAGHRSLCDSTITWRFIPYSLQQIHAIRDAVIFASYEYYSFIALAASLKVLNIYGKAVFCSKPKKVCDKKRLI